MVLRYAVVMTLHPEKRSFADIIQLSFTSCWPASFAFSATIIDAHADLHDPTSHVKKI